MEYRKSKDMMQKDVAARAGISKPFYSSIERGKRIPSLKNAMEIAQALDISLDSLYDLLFKTNNWSE